MSDAERRVRHELRSRAWSLLAAMPAALELSGPIEEVIVEGDMEVCLTVRRHGAAPGPPPAGVVGLAPVQRFLPGCWLTDLERAAVACLLEAPTRRRMTELRPEIEKRINQPVSEGVLKGLLARMADAAVGILSQDRSARPPGYAVTPEYRAFLAWAEQVRARAAAAEVA